MSLRALVKHLQGQHNQASHGRGKGGGKVTVQSWDPEGMWMDDDEPEGDPYDIANKAGIYVSSDKDARLVAVDENNQIVGASFVGVDFQSGEYAFDIAVAPGQQGKGIGSKLLDDTISDFHSESSEYPEMTKMATDVVNPAMRKMMERRGAKVVGKTPSGVMMELEP